MEFSGVKYKRANCVDNTLFKMIYIIDNFLKKDLYKNIDDSLTGFKEIKMGNKSFYINHASDAFVNYICLRLAIEENADIQNVLAFFRQSTDKLDNEWRIHSDLKINGTQPDRAAVLYISPTKYKKLHGTAFWDHNKYGDQLPLNSTNEEYDKLLLEDANDKKKWTLKSVIGYKPNRLISYPCNYFHSKYPNKSWKEGRNIFVIFYKIKK